MSYDLGLKGTKTTTCPHCNEVVSEEDVYIGFNNYTYNLGSLFYAAYSKKFDVGLEDFYGCKASLFGAALDVALKNIAKMPPCEIAKHEPSNGWGDAASFVEWLKGMRDACLENPDLEVTS